MNAENFKKAKILEERKQFAATLVDKFFRLVVVPVRNEAIVAHNSPETAARKDIVERFYTVVSNKLVEIQIEIEKEFDNL